jgi:hypothetical protein
VAGSAAHADQPARAETRELSHQRRADAPRPAGDQNCLAAQPRVQVAAGRSDASLGYIKEPLIFLLRLGLTRKECLRQVSQPAHHGII